VQAPLGRQTRSRHDIATADLSASEKRRGSQTKPWFAQMIIVVMTKIVEHEALKQLAIVLS